VIPIFSATRRDVLGMPTPKTRDDAWETLSLRPQPGKGSPAVAGVLVTYVSAALVLALDALSYVFLAVLVARMRLPESGDVSLVRRPPAAGSRCCGPIPSCSGCRR
jgi:hypothetical protein